MTGRRGAEGAAGTSLLVQISSQLRQAHTVFVSLTLLRVHEEFVGLVDLVEFVGGGILVLGLVRVASEGGLLVGGLDYGGGGFAWNTKGLVGIWRDAISHDGEVRDKAKDSMVTVAEKGGSMGRRRGSDLAHGWPDF